MKNLFRLCLLLSFSISIYSQIISSQNHSGFRDLKTGSKQFLKHKNKIDWKTRDSELKPDFISNLSVARIDSMISILFGDTSLYRFSYDGSGNVVGYTKYLKTGNVWVNYSRRIYTNNPLGKVQVMLIEDWENDQWYPYSRTTYTYNLLGLVDTELGEYYKTTGWINDYILINSYNSSGLVTCYLYKEWKTDKWENDSRESYQHNSNGKITLHTYETWYNSNWFLSNLYTYSFTDSGDLIEYYSESHSTSGGNSKRRQTNSYNPQKQLIQELYENFSDSNWVPTSRATYQYELNNLVEKITNEKWTANAWVNNSYIVDTLNENKQIVKHYLSSWSNSAWKPSSRETYTYNSKGKNLVYTKEAFSNNVWDLRRKQEFGYDLNDDLMVSFLFSSWYNGTPSEIGLILELDIASNLVEPFEISSSNLKIWYKSISVPVELASFSGNYKDGKISLKWNTATETNNRGFEVERKTINSGWVSLGFVAGAGTTAKPTNYIFEDKNIPEGKLYYRLKQIDLDGSVSYPQQIEVNTVAIKDFSLAQNYPNPFNPSTVINFNLPSECKVRVNIYNTTGQLVKELINGVKEAGTYNIKFDASRFSSGIYFYTIQAGQTNGKEAFRNTKKMILVK